MFDDPLLVAVAVAVGIGLMVLASRIRSRSIRRVDRSRRPPPGGPTS